ncbi:MAG: hypothetical protein LAT75_11580 [Candidatus Cyclonatronum sp.]|uniref:hypothetical protein n=1 Tax=Cyclonatronum sp. TaxID=3024185 RepID=UPI0025C50D41|nr:hypothetical protein [Cyclonatronum sp.]MCC5933398.1 hypothetical protein [Balneolales bacterium]MCH8487498.1 hypothetical protein [Cyclonatronum sp.]
MKVSKQFITILLIFAGSVYMMACSTGHSHVDANGVVLTLNGEEIARQDGTVVTYTQGNAIQLERGTPSGMIMVQFLNDNNELFTPEGDDYFLEVTIANPEIVGVMGEAQGGWGVELNPLQPGETNIQFEIFHVDHSDFTSRPFRFVIQEAEVD